ncbi:unnamed protein product [Dimorphilus gyrociliatus]|uniref:Uncharacterized protein n=1 Tax=Dimorphilus gyrociliatus TaxID=2664684 RepID=A0A7I8VDE3_9ANNE|nr:unnamed protein product [Dimorphilus gyrociliatus]
MFKPARNLSPNEYDELSGLQAGDRGPFIYTPLTKIVEHWFTYQFGPCADLELDYYRCASRVGEKQVDTKCRKMFEDLRECVFRTKTIERYYAIQNERKKQGLKPMDPPPKDAVYFNIGIGAEYPLHAKYKEFETE